MERYTIDRFEGETAVLVDDEARTSNVPLSLLPNGAREGDFVRRDDGGFSIDAELTKTRADEMRIRFERLKKKP